jgi:hypothetical protein
MTSSINARLGKVNNQVLKINMDFEQLNVEYASQYAYNKAIKGQVKQEILDSLRTEWFAPMALGDFPDYNGEKMKLGGEAVYFILDLPYFNEWPWLFLPDGFTSAEKYHMNADEISVCYGKNVELRIDDTGIYVMSAHICFISQFLKELLYKNLKIKVDPIIKTVDFNEYAAELTNSK